MISSGLSAADRDLLDALPPRARGANGVPDDELARDRERAAELVVEGLRDVLGPGGLRTSPLGPAWSTDLDAHVRSVPDRGRLLELGWLPLDRLLRRLGVREAHRWAVTDGGRVVGALDLHVAPVPDALDATLRRAARRREVRLREVLELRHLLRGGAELPDHPAVRAAATAEAALGGDELRRWLRGTPAPPPLPLGGLRRLVRRPRRRRRLVVAVSGVDGAGKSTLCRTIAAHLRRAGVPAAVVWTRPGMRIGWLDSAARLGKRLLGQDRRAAVGRVASGEGADVRSRRGVLGWVWALLVTLAFLRDVRRGHRGGRGVLLFDRHLLDALVTLDVGYAGVRLDLHRRLVRRFLPPADLTVYLDLPAEVAVARKPDPLFGEAAVRRQLDRYAAVLGEVRRGTRLDATAPAGELASAMLRLLVEGPSTRRSGRPGRR